jgi:hypothetical protein
VSAPINTTPLVVQVPSMRPSSIQFSLEAVAFCKAKHTEGPCFPCPVCFLLLCYTQAMVDFAKRLVEATAAQQEELGELSAAAKQVLADFEEIPNKVLAHVQVKGGAQ